MLYTTIFAIAACLTGPLCAAMPSPQIHARSEGNNTLTLDAQITAYSPKAHVTRAEVADFDPPIHVSFYTYGKRVVVDGIYWADDTTYSDDEVNNDPDLVKFGSQSTYPGERDFWEFVGQMWQSKRLDHPRTFKWTPDSSKVLPITCELDVFGTPPQNEIGIVLNSVGEKTELRAEGFLFTCEGKR